MRRSIADALDHFGIIGKDAVFADTLVVEGRQHQHRRRAGLRRRIRKPHRIGNGAGTGARHQAIGRDAGVEKGCREDRASPRRSANSLPNWCRKSASPAPCDDQPAAESHEERAIRRQRIGEGRQNRREDTRKRRGSRHRRTQMMPVSMAAPASDMMRRPPAWSAWTSLSREADAQAKPDADKVQDGGRKHEADAIGQSGCIGRHFGAMRMAVKQGEEADQCHGAGNRQVPLHGHGKAKHDDRGSNADFNEGHLDAGNAQGTTHRHHRDEA